MSDICCPKLKVLCNGDSCESIVIERESEGKMMIQGNWKSLSLTMDLVDREDYDESILNRMHID